MVVRLRQQVKTKVFGLSAYIRPTNKFLLSQFPGKAGSSLRGGTRGASRERRTLCAAAPFGMTKETARHAEERGICFSGTMTPGRVFYPGKRDRKE
jgi:hypothetical protein